MEEPEIIEIIEDVIYNEIEIDFTGIMIGKYSINEAKNMLIGSLVKELRRKIK